MKSKEQIKKWLLKNCVDKYGTLDLSELDFSDFDGDIDIKFMRVKKNLIQNYQEVYGNLYQDCQEVYGDLYQTKQEVKGKLYQ